MESYYLPKFMDNVTMNNSSNKMSYMNHHIPVIKIRDDLLRGKSTHDTTTVYQGVPEMIMSNIVEGFESRGSQQSGYPAYGADTMNQNKIVQYVCNRNGETKSKETAVPASPASSECSCNIPSCHICAHRHRPRPRRRKRREEEEDEEEEEKPKKKKEPLPAPTAMVSTQNYAPIAYSSYGSGGMPTFHVDININKGGMGGTGGGMGGAGAVPDNKQKDGTFLGFSGGDSGYDTNKFSSYNQPGQGSFGTSPQFQLPYQFAMQSLPQYQQQQQQQSTPMPQKQQSEQNFMPQLLQQYSQQQYQNEQSALLQKTQQQLSTLQQQIQQLTSKQSSQPQEQPRSKPQSTSPIAHGFITQPALVGNNTLTMPVIEDVQIGMYALISNGTTNEIHKIIEITQLTLDEPLQNNYPTGSSVYVYTSKDVAYTAASIMSGGVGGDKKTKLCDSICNPTCPAGMNLTPVKYNTECNCSEMICTTSNLPPCTYDTIDNSCNSYGFFSRVIKLGAKQMPGVNCSSTNRDASYSSIFLPCQKPTSAYVAQTAPAFVQQTTPAFVQQTTPAFVQQTTPVYVQNTPPPNVESTTNTNTTPTQQSSAGSSSNAKSGSSSDGSSDGSSGGSSGDGGIVTPKH